MSQPVAGIVNHLNSKEKSKQFWVTASAGAILIGITLPTLLVSWQRSFTLLEFDDFPGQHPKEQSIVGSLLQAEIPALILCGPGAVLLTVLLYYHLRHSHRSMEIRPLANIGMMIGVLCAFMNLPAYLSSVFIDWNRPFAAIRYLMLFVVAGATCGMWIAWQAYRSNHPGTGFFPRYRLSTLLMLVLAWGALLALYAPPAM